MTQDFRNNGYIQVVVAVLIILIILVSGFFLVRNANTIKDNKTSDIIRSIVNIGAPAPTPFLFEEMTIPYLRNRPYVSSLGTLEKVSQNQNYTSYATSYNSDGLNINGLLTVPAGEQPTGGWPGIVFIHGYIPPATYQTLGKSYSAYVDYLARNGFVVFKIDLRGNGNSEGDAGGAYYSSDYVIDTLNAYSALQSSGFVNSKEIGLWGHSMAGNIVMRSFAAKPNIPAVVIWAGAGYTYTDLSDYRIQDLSYRPQPTNSPQQKKRSEIRRMYGDPKDGNPFWKLVAPTSYLNDLNGAIQIHHAVDDSTVSIEYSRNLNNLLGTTKVTHELDEYQSGGHNISGTSFNIAMQKTVDFFKKYLIK